MLIINVPPQRVVPQPRQIVPFDKNNVRSDKCLEFYHGEYAQGEWMVPCDTQTRHLFCLHFHTKILTIGTHHKQITNNTGNLFYSPFI